MRASLNFPASFEMITGHTSPFSIIHLPFATCHLPFATCHLPFTMIYGFFAFLFFASEAE
jgi:hypothetical protein